MKKYLILTLFVNFKKRTLAEGNNFYMKRKILAILLLANQSFAHSLINIQLPDNLFVRVAVPKKGIVCSNQDRATRISRILKNVKTHTSKWGPKIYIGNYKGQELFIASVPVGSGSGLMFTELYAAGAEYIIRYGSDDLKNTTEKEEELVKVINETDNLYGYEKASGVPEEEWGKSIFASPIILKALRDEAIFRKIIIDERICHHLENYHALRNPEKFSPARAPILKQQLAAIKRTDKNESFDMESAVLFRVAKDFDKHAAAVLQTVNKKDAKEGPYEGNNRKKAISLERTFTEYVLTSLLRIN